MSDKALLEKLWQSYAEQPFSKFSLHRKSDLCHDDLTTTLELLQEMSETGDEKHGFRVKKPASTVFKLIPTKKDALICPTSDSKEMIKGKPLAESKDKSTDDTGLSYQTDRYPVVPAELKVLPQWVLWKSEVRDSEPTKIPKQSNGRNAKSNEPSTWTDYPSVCKVRDRFDGIGFVFSSSDPYCGIDLDKCLDVSGELKAWAMPIVDRLKAVAYGEISPSGKGIKFWTKARLPILAKHKVYLDETTGEAIEAYDSGRYFTVTGKGRGRIEEGQQVIDWLVQEYLSPLTTTPRPTQPLDRNPSADNRSADEVISDIRASKQCPKFDALMAGNTTGYGSQSEADIALCSVVAFWTQAPNVIDAIFRQSALMRAKWDEPHRGDKSTYGQMTIEAALSGNHETYKPKQNRKPYSPTRRRLHRTRQLYGDLR